MRSRRSNSKTNKQDKHDATEVLEDFLGLSTNFELTKKYLSRYGSYYINYLFSMLGYQYKGFIEEPNVFHLAAQAWMLGASAELKKDRNPKEKVSYSGLLNLIKQIIVEENLFGENMKLLSGIYGIESNAIKDDRLFKIFLVNINESKNDILKHEKQNSNSTKEDFDKLFLRIFRSAFNYTLNDLSSEKEDKKSLDLMNLYSELKQGETKLTLDDYITSYFENQGLDQNNMSNPELLKIKIRLSTFFNFCETSLDDLLDEIELFNENAYSTIYMIKNILSMKNLKRMTIKYYELVTNAVEKGLINLRLESVLNFYKNCYQKVEPIGTQAVQKVSAGYTTAKGWIFSAAESCEGMYEPFLKKIRYYSKNAYNTSLELTETPRLFVHDKIYKPVANLTLKVANQTLTLGTSVYNLSKENINKLNNFILSTVQSSFDGVKNVFFGEDPLIKVEYEKEGEGEENYMTISISKKLFLVDPEKASKLVSKLMEFMKNLSLQKTAGEIYIYSKEKVNDTKLYIKNAYRKFLELAKDEECPDKCTNKQKN